MLKNNRLFATKVFVWSSSASKKRSQKKKICLYKDGMSLGSEFFPYLKLSDLSVSRDGWLHFKHEGAFYKWGRLNRISGGVDAALTCLLGVAVSDANKGNESEFLECITIAKKYVRRENTIGIGFFTFVSCLGISFGFLPFAWFVDAPLRSWLLVAGLVLVPPFLLRKYADRRYLMVENILKRRGSPITLKVKKRWRKGARKESKGISKGDTKKLVKNGSANEF